MYGYSKEQKVGSGLRILKLGGQINRFQPLLNDDHLPETK